MTGNRKLTAWFWIFGFAAGFTVVRMLLPLFTEMGGLDDLPSQVVDIIKWATLFFFAANVLGDHGASAVKSAAEALAAKKQP